MATDRTSSGFGATLREARERRGVSLRDIANATKISVGFLEALERNDIARLPGGIFSRSFVRSYAIQVGLDPDRTILEFIAQFPNDSVTAGHPVSDQVEDNEALESDRKMAGTLIWLVVISVPIAAAVLYYATVANQQRPQPSAPAAVAVPRPETTPAAAPASADPAALTEAAPPAAESSTAKFPSSSRAPLAATSAAGSAAATASAPPIENPTDRLTVSLTATRPCWVSATVDGQKAIERLLQIGEQKTVEVRRELVLTAGDASAIVLTFNGATARPLGKAGEVVTARFNLANFKDYVQAR
ncbi:MAG TPA: RodZ domain-containing protein [Vicinamibacterales bacterium]|jgi:cytoskeletal protein RodZ